MEFNHYPVYLSEDEYIQFWKDYFNEHELKDNEEVSIYVHYPWCRSVCKFCVFGALKYDDNKRIIKPYEDAVLRVMKKMAPIIEDKKIAEIFFGGGTPSLWSYEALSEMTKIIPNWDKIDIRRTEVHPSDMTDERINFMVDVMKFDHVSMGIQSFDIDACHGQNRIHVSPYKLAEIVKKFHDKGIMVNCDLVAMFNGPDPKNWDIFRQDLLDMANIVKPDGITVSPNYREDYYNDSVEFRKIIKAFSDNQNVYHINYGDWAFSLDKMDIIRYMDNCYMFLTDEYSKFSSRFHVLHETKNKEYLDSRNMIAFGGIHGESAFARTSEYHYLSGNYIPGDDEFIYTLKKQSMFERMAIKEDKDYFDKPITIGQGFHLQPPDKI